mmetsp:Transcript_4849/g.12917  ORF Transcript_4849/g.12917 Transcript_4849/m.12917 type:complete len:255 (-) Transcript_4849:219-983(-)
MDPKQRHRVDRHRRERVHPKPTAQILVTDHVELHDELPVEAIVACEEVEAHADHKVPLDEDIERVPTRLADVEHRRVPEPERHEHARINQEEDEHEVPIGTELAVWVHYPVIEWRHLTLAHVGLLPLILQSIEQRAQRFVRVEQLAHLWVHREQRRRLLLVDVLVAAQLLYARRLPGRRLWRLRCARRRRNRRRRGRRGDIHLGPRLRLLRPWWAFHLLERTQDPAERRGGGLTRITKACHHLVQVLHLGIQLF